MSMTTNKHALLPTKEEARDSGNILIIVAARLVRMECFTPLHFLSEIPQRVVSMRALREALERSQDNLRNEVSKIVDGHNRMADRLKEAEGKLEASERRNAELEARVVVLPQRYSMLHRVDFDEPYHTEMVYKQHQMLEALHDAGISIAAATDKGA